VLLTDGNNNTPYPRGPARIDPGAAEFHPSERWPLYRLIG